MRLRVCVVSAMLWGGLACAIFSARSLAQETSPQISAPLQVLARQTQTILEREASYRAIDYEYLNPTEEGYLQALQIAETNATLSAIYRYARYSEKTFRRVQDGRKILVPLLDQTHISHGLLKKRMELESEVGVGEDRGLYEWRRSLWITRMANYSALLRALDESLAHENNKARKKELKGERDRLIEDEPILAVKVTMPFNTKDRRPAYIAIDDLYRRIPEANLTCLENTKECLPSSILQWKTGEWDEFREQIKREREWVIQYGDQALAELFSPRNRQVYRGEPFTPLNVVREVLQSFPGGEERYFSLLDEIRSESDDERLIHQVRDRIAFQLIEPALESTIDTLKKELLGIPSRSFADYLSLSQLRTAVISSFPETWRAPMAQIDHYLVKEERRFGRLRTAGDIAFVLGVGASLYFFPPAAGLAMFESPLVWTRIAATGLHAYAKVRRAGHQADIADVRALSGLGSYEWAALAESQYRMAVLFAYLDVFLPLRIGSAVRPTLSKIGEGLGRFATTPLGKEEILEFSVGQNNPLRLLVRALPRGGAMVRKISENTWQAWKEVGRLVSLAGRGEFRAAATLLPKTTVSKALLNAGTSGLIMVGTERITRGPKFYQEVGTYRNVLITLLIDGATGFYGLGSFSTMEKMVAIGGTVFSMSILGQVLTGISDPKSLGVRAAGETAYCITLSPWKIVFADQLAGKVAALQPGWPLWRVGTEWAFFTANNGVGNLIYSYGTKSLFEFSDPPNDSPWWTDSKSAFDRLQDHLPPRVAEREPSKKSTF